MEITKEIKETLLSLYADFNGNSNRVEAYLEKRIDLFNKINMPEAKQFYNKVRTEFFMQENLNEQIRLANKKNEEDVSTFGTWH